MAMGRRRKRARQEGLWTPTAALPVGASHPFYQRLNQILDEKKFDEYVEGICERFYADEVGRPGLAPGIYFRNESEITSEIETLMASLGSPTEGLTQGGAV